MEVREGNELVGERNKLKERKKEIVDLRKFDIM